MALKPEASLGVSLATAAVVYATYTNMTPPIADIRSLDPNNTDIAKSERLATWTSAGVVAGISLLARDATIFVIGGAMVVAMAWAHRHANRVDQTKDAARQLLPTQTAGPIGNTPSGVTQGPPMAAVAINYGTSVV